MIIIMNNCFNNCFNNNCSICFNNCFIMVIRQLKSGFDAVLTAKAIIYRNVGIMTYITLCWMFATIHRTEIEPHQWTSNLNCCSPG